MLSVVKKNLAYWLQRYWSLFFYSLFAIAIAIFVGLKFGSKKKNSSAFGIKSALHSWEAAEKADGPELERLTHLLEKHSSVIGTGGTAIVEQFIARGVAEKAGLVAEKILEQVGAHTPEISLFAKASLLIAQGAFQEALEEAAFLKTALVEKNKGESLLYGYTLLRMVTLCHKLKIDQPELDEELSFFLKKESSASIELHQIFSSEGFSLEDFLHSARSAAMHDQAHPTM